MLTADELVALPIFSTLSPVALADVARAAADIRLNAGEYAVYEGEPPALFVVIEGAIEVIKLVDGLERKIGMRLPGVLFCATVAHLHSATRHLVDPIDQLAHVFLIRVETKLVLRFGFVAQTRHQYVRMIWNAHTVAGQKPQTGNHRRRFTAVQNHRHLEDCQKISAANSRNCGTLERRGVSPGVSPG